MRKLILCLLALLIPVLLFAYNGQKVIPLESDVYSAIDTLYLLEQFSGQGKCFGSIRADHMSKDLAHVIYSCNLFE